jgi:hypothetical protein
MTSLERLSVAGLMALSAGLGATGAVYLRPLQPAQQQTATAPVAPVPVPVVEPIRTVTWFKAHRSELDGKLALCGDNPGLGQHDPECANAGEAKDQNDIEDFVRSAPGNTKG